MELSGNKDCRSSLILSIYRRAVLRVLSFPLNNSFIEIPVGENNIFLGYLIWLNLF